MFGDMGVFTKVELEARTEVKWETYTKKIQIEGRVLGDLAMNHIVPIASKYEAQLLDKVYKMHQIGGLNASSDILLIKKIQDHTASIQKLTGEMIDAQRLPTGSRTRVKRPLPTTIPWLSASTRSAAISTSWKRSSTIRSGRCRSIANCCSCADRADYGIEKPGTFLSECSRFWFHILRKLFVVAVHVFHVNGVLHRLALRDRRLGEVLAAAKLLQDARALVFTFELFQGALDVFALFYRHDNHNILLFFVVLNLFVRSENCGVRILDASSPKTLVLFVGRSAVRPELQIRSQPCCLLAGQYVLFHQFSSGAPTSFQLSCFQQFS